MGIFDWKSWVVILVVVVLLFGTKRLKNLGADLGETIKGFRKSMNNDEQTQAEQPVAVAPAKPQVINQQAEDVQLRS